MNHKTQERVGKIKDQVWNSMKQQVEDEIWNLIWSEIRTMVWYQVVIKVQEQIRINK